MLQPPFQVTGCPLRWRPEGVTQVHRSAVVRAAAAQRARGATGYGARGGLGGNARCPGGYGHSGSAPGRAPGLRVSVLCVHRLWLGSFEKLQQPSFASLQFFPSR